MLRKNLKCICIMLMGMLVTFVGITHDSVKAAEYATPFLYYSYTAEEFAEEYGDLFMSGLGYASYFPNTSFTELERFEQKYDEDGKPVYTDVVIPDETVYGAKIELIGSSSFLNHTEITSVTLGKNVKGIRGEAFQGCTNLTSVTIPEGCVAIDGGFSGCTSLTSITIPDSCVYIGGWAFRGCTGLTSITIPKNCTYIGEGAFEGCTNLKSIKFEGVPTVIGADAFAGTKYLTDAVKTGNMVLTQNGILLDGSNAKDSLALKGTKVKMIADAAFYKNKKLTKLTINGVKTVGKYAFRGSGVKTLTLKNINKIGEGAFYNTSVNTLNLQKVNRICQEAFRGCKKLKKVNIKTVKNIEKNIFYRCTKLRTAKVYGVEKIGKNMFYGCKNLRKVVLGAKTRVLRAGCFWWCNNLKTVVIQSKKKLVWKTGKIDTGGFKLRVFHACDKLKKVTLKSSKPAASIKKVFQKQVTLNVPNKAKKAYLKLVSCKVV